MTHVKQAAFNRIKVFGLLSICAFFFGFTPSAQAELFSCCLCHISKADQSADFCLNVTPVSSCPQASADLATIYNDKTFTADCQPLDANQCVKISSGNPSAHCPFDPATHSSVAKTDINKAYINTAFKNLSAQAQQAPASSHYLPASSTNIKLNVPIPGVSFPTNLYVENQVLYIPYLAIYLSEFQKYLIGIGIVAAAIMVLFGGFKYLISATGANIQDAKELVKDALIGLALILGCYVILANVNPNTTGLAVLKVPYIQPDFYTTPTAPMNAVAGNATHSNEDAIVEGAKLAGADPCNILALCEHETGLRQIWDGWPKNQKEASFMWGACSASAQLLGDGKQFDVSMRKAFPSEWPALGTDLPIPKGQGPSYKYMPVKAELMINNSKMDGYLIGLQMKSATIKTTADIGIGSANIDRWRLANGCTPAKNFTFAEASTMGVEAAIAASCLPDAAAGGEGCPNDNQNCSPVDYDKVNTITKGYKIETNGTIHGVCASTNKQCFTIWTKEHVRYAIKSYQRFDSKYHCTTAGKK